MDLNQFLVNLRNWLVPKVASLGYIPGEVCINQPDDDQDKTITIYISGFPLSILNAPKHLGQGVHLDVEIRRPIGDGSGIKPQKIMEDAIELANLFRDRPLGFQTEPHRDAAEFRDERHPNVYIVAFAFLIQID